MLFQCSTVILLATVNNVLGQSVYRRGIGRRGDTPNLPYDPSTTTKCEYWYDNEAGSLTCSDILDIFGVSLANFRSLNPTITATCGGFTTGKAYCVLGEPDGKAPSSTPSSTTTPSTKPTTAKTTSSATKSTPITTPKPATTSIKTTSTSKTTTTSAGNGIPTPTPTHPGISPNCDAFVLVVQGDTCASIAKANGITLAQFVAWNTGVGGEQCLGMWANVYACVSILGHTPTPTNPGNGVTTPEPIQAGMTGSCKDFHFVQQGDTCAGLAGRYGVSVGDIVAWNPAVGAGCTGMWSGTWACVGIL